MTSENNNPSGPLLGMRVLDLTQTLMGPYCTQILADLGADVIKIESKHGDTTRFIPPGLHDDIGAMFENLNRGKKSIVLDLKSPAGKEALLRLAAKSDVFLHSMRPKAIERLGITYEVLSEVNSQIIYANLTGFGRDGPYADFPAYDDIMQAATGLTLLQADLNQSAPSYLASVVSDKVTGLTGVYAILAALLIRERNGGGQEVQVNMFETMTSFVMVEHICGSLFDPPIGPPVYPRVVSAKRRPFATEDGYISMMVYNDKQWGNFFAALEHPLWSKDPMFSTITQRTLNIDAVYGKLADILTTRTTEQWLELCRQAEIPAMPLLSTADLIRDPHLNAVGFWQDKGKTGEQVRYPGIPTHFSKTPGSIRSTAPALGVNTKEVLRQEGFSETEIDEITGSHV